MQERVDFKLIATTQLIKDIRQSIEILLSIKNDQTANGNTGGNIDTSLMHEESLLGLSAHNPYGSPQSTNPFDKADSHVRNLREDKRLNQTSAERRTR